MRREQAVEVAEHRFHLSKVAEESLPASERFEKRVFSLSTMQRQLPAEIYQNVLEAVQGAGRIRPDYADPIALAMKEWALGLGATHYCHWFQPLTGATAEKHDTFFAWGGSGEAIEQFDGKQLVQGEPDASSFPSGGLRSTYEARGYTGWDPSSPAFVWLAGDGVTLCIPSVFYSWTGAVLDHKIPLQRSEARANQAILRLLEATGVPAKRVHSNVGWEQEYFVVDRGLRTLRPDLVLAGRTVFGAPPPKGQELEDHYFGAVKDRVLSFMQEFEDAALELGVPIKTRHNEVAPAQHETAPLFEKASTSIDHNILVMELMRQVAAKQDLACLMHEKPFAGVNGSGKHVNWSLATDTGLNLLDPRAEPGIVFLFVLTAILHGVYRHADLLRAAIASRSNDFRLGSHEAPPAIISVFLGEELEELLTAIEEDRPVADQGKGPLDLGLLHIPELPRDNTDRNRTSPFAFTGNKFEYRAVGSLANCAVPVTILNLLVAESLTEMLDAVDKVEGKENFAEKALGVLRTYLKESKSIRFGGDNYSDAWEKEAKKRGLPNLSTTPQALAALKTQKAHRLFEEVLTPEELTSRWEIATEQYSKTVNIEANLCRELFQTHVLPAALETLGQMQSVEAGPGLKRVERELSETIESAIKRCHELERAQTAAQALALEQQSDAFCHQVAPACDALRDQVDRLEGWCDDAVWPLPKYRELLFLV